MDFNFQVPNEEGAKESVSEDEIDPEVYCDTPSSVPLLGELEVPAKVGSSLLLVGASPSDLYGLEAHTTVADRSSASNI